MDPRLEKKYSEYVTTINIIRVSILMIIVPLCVYLFFILFMFAVLILIALWVLGEAFIEWFYKKYIFLPVYEDFAEMKIKRHDRNLDLEQLCIFSESNYNYTNSFALNIGNKEYVITNFNAGYYRGKYYHLVFGGHIYECGVPYSCDVVVFVCKSFWKHKHVGALVYKHGKYEVRTSTGFLPDNMENLFENRLFPMLERMKLRDHAMVIIRGKLYILENHDWNFQIGYFTNLKKQIERDSSVFKKIRLNLEVINEMIPE